MAKRGTVITELNRLIEFVEAHLSDDLDIGALAASLGTSEYHVRRMFSSLTGMPLSEYVRRRRMTVAAAEVIAGAPLLDIAVRFGYGSAEAFGRAFRAVHGAPPAVVRNEGGPLRSQPLLRLRLTVEGKVPMETRITDRPAFRLVGYAVRVPLVHSGPNPHIVAHITSLRGEDHERLRALSTTEPVGLLQVSDDVDPDYTEGSELTYLHGAAVHAATTVPSDLDVIEVPSGTWAVFRTTGPYPAALQDTYAATASEWFPSNPWLLRPGPSIVAVLDRADDFSTATTELWVPVERSRAHG
jgi:AraC family transcriptional regulator